MFSRRRLLPGSLMLGGVIGDASRRYNARNCRLRRPATADLELLARIPDRTNGAKNLGAELAVRLADDLHRMLVVNDVTCRRIDADVAARTVARIGFDLVDERIAVELAVELLWRGRRHRSRPRCWP